MSSSDAQLRLPPMARLLAAIVIFAISAVAALWLATAQPWLGLVMRAGDDGLIGLVEVQRNDLPVELRPGVRITHIGMTELRAGDLIEEPDTLFSRGDADRVQQLVELMDHALESRDAQERGARQERTRMARDLHDNIGAQLLRTLHSADTGRKDAIISETLTDLRDIINNAQGTGMVLAEILADLRFETDERLGAVDIVLRWDMQVDEDRVVDTRLTHTLRSIIREAASNTIRHASASRFEVSMRELNGGLHLNLSDDGIGTGEVTGNHEGGLVNMATRAERHGGHFRIAMVSGLHIPRSGEGYDAEAPIGSAMREN